MNAQQIARLRKEVKNIQKATDAGSKDFELMAELHDSLIHSCRYNEIGYIYCDTMVIKNGRTAITEQNLQYYPAKVRYFFTKTEDVKNVYTLPNNEVRTLTLHHKDYMRFQNEFYTLIENHGKDRVLAMFTQGIAGYVDSRFYGCYSLDAINNTFVKRISKTTGNAYNDYTPFKNK